MEDRPDIGLDSHDRLFPSQDTLPQGGFGNLIALCAAYGSRAYSARASLRTGMSGSAFFQSVKRSP